MSAGLAIRCKERPERSVDLITPDTGRTNEPQPLYNSSHTCSLIHMTFVPILFGLPLYLYFGIVTFIAMITTATLGYLFLKGKFGVKFAWHKYMAITTIILAIIHVTLVISVYFF
jgi:hypothetical protein